MSGGEDGLIRLWAVSGSALLPCQAVSASDTAIGTAAAYTVPA